MNRGFGETLIAIGVIFMLFAVVVSLSGCAKPRKMDWGRMLDEAGFP